MWDNARDANSYLSGTIVLLNNSPVYIELVGPDMYIHGTNLRDGSNYHAPLASAEIQQLPLGYLNLQGGAVYVARSPARRWKHGIDAANLFVKKNRAFRGRFNPHESGPELSQCLDNSYLSLEDVIATLSGMSGKAGDMAFDRHFAVKAVFSSNSNGIRGVKGIKLCYRGDEVGSINEKMEAVLNPKYSFLRERLEEKVRVAA